MLCEVTVNKDVTLLTYLPYTNPTLHMFLILTTVTCGSQIKASVIALLIQ